MKTMGRDFRFEFECVKALVVRPLQSKLRKFPSAGISQAPNANLSSLFRAWSRIPLYEVEFLSPLNVTEKNLNSQKVFSEKKQY